MSTTGPEDFQASVGAWAEATFPRSTPLTVVKHLRREAQELVNVVYQGGCSEVGVLEADLADEAADCALLLLHLCHKLGISLWGAMLDKHARNMGRTWGEPDAEGVVEHVRDGGGS